MRLFFINIFVIIPFFLNAQDIYTLDANRIKISDNGIIYGYYYDTDDTLNYNIIKVPDSIKEIKVIGIESIGLPEKSIKKIILPDNLLYLGCNFLNNQLLDTIMLPSHLLYLGDGAFTNNNFASLKLPFPQKANHKFIGWNDSIQDNYILDLKHSFSQPAILIAYFEYLKRDAYPIDINDVWEDKGIIKKCYYRGSKNIIIPSKMGDFNITEIGKQSFNGMCLENVIIDEGIDEINEFAFTDNNIDCLKFPSTMKRIGKFAFSRNKIDKLIFPFKINVIGKGSFENNLLEEIILPESLDSIKIRAFSENRLNRVEIPTSVKYIGYNAFANNNFSEENIPKLPYSKKEGKTFLYWQSFKKGKYIRELKSYEEIPVGQCQPGEEMNLELGYKAVFKEDL